MNSVQLGSQARSRAFPMASRTAAATGWPDPKIEPQLGARQRTVMAGS